MILVGSQQNPNNKNSEFGSLFLHVLLLWLLVACQPVAERQSLTYSGPIMGTDFSVTVVIPAGFAADKLKQDIFDQLQAVNARMSTYLADSELNQFNRLGADTEFKLSESLRSVISEALEISSLSQGAFDITVGPVVQMWGFGSDGVIQQPPSTQQLQDLALRVGYQKLSLESNRLSKSNAGTNIDLSAIAKGYAVDQVSRMLTEQGLHDHLVEVGGELRASGKKLNHQPWRVAIEKPHLSGGVQQVIELDNSAIATSGDYRNYLTVDGKKYSHTIDPLTLKPVFHRLALVSVMSKNASTADALATALMVMGEQVAPEFAEKLDLAAYFLIRNDDGSGFDIKYTHKFASILR